MEDYAGSFLLFSPTTGLYTATISRAFHLATRFSFVYRRAGMERFSRHGLEKGRTRRTQFVLIRECENLLLHSLYYILFQRLSSRNHFARELLRNDIRLHVLISLLTSNCSSCVSLYSFFIYLIQKWVFARRKRKSRLIVVNLSIVVIQIRERDKLFPRLLEFFYLLLEEWIFIYNINSTR